MEVFRISKLKRVRDLSGFGASLKGQRWNRRGTSLLYTASYRSLALLEVVVHLPVFPEEEYAIATLDVPTESITALAINQLPNQWSRYLQPGALAYLTDEWLTQEKYLAFRVPSAIVEQEYNYLLNPLHPNYNEIKIKHIEAFRFDDRLFKSY
jgi:RES domain-containing protein